MLTNKEIAQKILNVSSKSYRNRIDLKKSWKEEFDGNSIWIICYLASDWYNDLIEWAENEIDGVENII
jgi:hypothetical protein